jgi:polysaccharide biosynthesis transport protein
MDLRSYVRFLRENWEAVAALTLIGVIVAMGFALLTKPKFSSTSELFLTTPGYSSLGSLSTNESSPYQADVYSQQRARSYVKLATREDLARRVIARLNLDVKPEDLVAAISASAEPDTVLIRVTVESNTAAQAKVLADAVTAELSNDIRTLELPGGILVPNVDPVVTQPASTPQKPSEPNVAAYLLFGAAGGFLVGITTAAWLRRARAIRGPQEVEQITDRPVLTTLQSDNDEVENAAMWQAIQRRVAFELDGDGDRHQPNEALGRVIAVAAAAESEESSAVAQQLASAFARAGSRTVVVPTYGNHVDYVLTAQSPGIGLAGVLAAASTLAEAIQSTETAGLSYLAGPGPDNPIPLLQSEKFGDLVSELRESFDLVVFDSPDFCAQAESTVLTDVLDFVILTVTDELTPKRYLLAAVRLLRKWNADLLCTILNSGVRTANARDGKRPLAALRRGITA